MLVSVNHTERSDWLCEIARAPVNLTLELLAKIERVIRAVIATVLSCLGPAKAEQKKETPLPPAVVPTPPTLSEKTVAQFVWNHKGKIAIGSLVVLGVALAIWSWRDSELDSFDPLLDRIRWFSECRIEDKKWEEYLLHRAECKNPYYPIRNLTATRLCRGCKPPDYLPDF